MHKFLDINIPIDTTNKESRLIVSVYFYFHLEDMIWMRFTSILLNVILNSLVSVDTLALVLKI